MRLPKRVWQCTPARRVESLGTSGFCDVVNWICRFDLMCLVDRGARSRVFQTSFEAAPWCVRRPAGHWDAPCLESLTVSKCLDTRQTHKGESQVLFVLGFLIVWIFWGHLFESIASQALFWTPLDWGYNILLPVGSKKEPRKKKGKCEKIETKSLLAHLEIQVTVWILQHFHRHIMDSTVAGPKIAKNYNYTRSTDTWCVLKSMVQNSMKIRRK